MHTHLSNRYRWKAPNDGRPVMSGKNRGFMPPTLVLLIIVNYIVYSSFFRIAADDNASQRWRISRGGRNTEPVAIRMTYDLYGHKMPDRNDDNEPRWTPAQYIASLTDELAQNSPGATASTPSATFWIWRGLRRTRITKARTARAATRGRRRDVRDGPQFPVPAAPSARCAAKSRQPDQIVDGDRRGLSRRRSACARPAPVRPRVAASRSSAIPVLAGRRLDAHDRLQHGNDVGRFGHRRRALLDQAVGALRRADRAASPAAQTLRGPVRARAAR